MDVVHARNSLEVGNTVTGIVNDSSLYLGSDFRQNKTGL